MGATEIVEAMLHALVDGRFDDAGALMDPEVVFDNVPIGVVVGRDRVVEMVSNGLMSKSDEVVWDVLSSVVDGDRVMNERLDRFRVGEQWVEIPVAGVFEVRDGLVVLWRDYCDIKTVERQLPDAMLRVMAQHQKRVN